MQNNQVARNAKFTVLQIVVSAVALFLLYRYLLRAIGVEAIGVWSVVLATMSLSRVADFGLALTTTRLVARGIARGGPELAREYAETAVLMALGAYLAIALLAYPIISWFLQLAVPATHLSIAQVLLRYGAASFWLSGVTSVILAATDGTHRIDRKSTLVMAGTLVQFAFVLLLVPRYGLLGLAFAQILQGSFLLLGSWFLLQQCLNGRSLLPRRWSHSAFRETLRSGSQLQLISIMVALSEPVTKGLLTRFGGLTAAGYFELATRMIQQARGLLVNVNQVLVPTIANLEEIDRTRVSNLYRYSYRVMVYMAVPIFSALIGLSPLISWLWIGHYEPGFVLFTVLLAIAWLVNALSAPAYFAGLGRGHLRWNLIGHSLHALLNVALGASLGLGFGGVGVVVGASTALIIGSVATIVGYHSEDGEVLRALIPMESGKLAMACLAAALVGLASHYLLPVNRPSSPGFAEMLGPFLVAPVIVWSVWRHPLRRRLTSWAFQDR